MTDLNASIARIPIPPRMRKLKISPKGFPVPWFVAWIDGVPDFRVVDTPKVARAYRMRLCWLCGEPLGRHLAFVIGPMCAINRTSSEPPSHRECAQYAVAACPFLTRPRMRRNDNDLPRHIEPGGIMLERNPGVTLLWMTGSYSVHPQDRRLFKLGPPEEVAFYCEGRAATRAEVVASIDSGMGALEEAARQGGQRALDQLAHMFREAMRLLPAA